MTTSKRLGHDDTSGFEFAREMLAGDTTAAINFDRLQWHPRNGYVIFEYLLCEEDQLQKSGTTPWTSHPRKYWEKNKRKFLALWRAARDLNAILYLVNYAKKGTEKENEILLIKVLGMKKSGITKEQITMFTRPVFQRWFRVLNAACLNEGWEGPEDYGIVYLNPKTGFYHKDRDCVYISDNSQVCLAVPVEQTEIYASFKPCIVCAR